MGYHCIEYFVLAGFHLSGTVKDLDGSSCSESEKHYKVSVNFDRWASSCL